MVAKSNSRKNLIASLAVWLLILLYIGLFSWQSVARHQAFATNAYDMGNVNQAFWNTVHGRPLQFTNWRGVELDLANDSRLAMHVEPIYFVLAPIYWLWQQPETILILQTIILALGALPVFWLARDRLRSHAGRRRLRRGLSAVSRLGSSQHVGVPRGRAGRSPAALRLLLWPEGSLGPALALRSPGDGYEGRGLVKRPRHGVLLRRLGPRPGVAGSPAARRNSKPGCAAQSAPRS